MVTGFIIKIGAIVVSLVTFGLFVNRASQVGIGNAGLEISNAIGSFGKGIGQVGTGINVLGTGIGGGIRGIFSPFEALFKLFKPAAAAGAPTATIPADSGLVPAGGQAGARSRRGGFTSGGSTSGPRITLNQLPKIIIPPGAKTRTVKAGTRSVALAKALSRLRRNRTSGSATAPVPIALRSTKPAVTRNNISTIRSAAQRNTARRGGGGRARYGPPRFKSIAGSGRRR